VDWYFCVSPTVVSERDRESVARRQQECSAGARPALASQLGHPARVQG